MDKRKAVVYKVIVNHNGHVTYPFGFVATAIKHQIAPF
jgi:hypothetical protein